MGAEQGATTGAVAAGAEQGLDRRSVLVWRNAVLVLFAVMGVATGTWIARLPAIRDGLGLRLDEMGVLVFAVAAGSIAGLLFAGMLVARFGARAVLLIAQSTCFVGLLVAGFGISVAHSVPVAFAGFVLFGSLAAMTDVAANVTGAANERAIGKPVMPVFHAFFSIGTLAGSGLGALAELVQLPVAWHFLVVACAAVLVVQVAGRRLVPESATFQDAAEEGGDRVPLRQRLRGWADPRTLLIGVMVLCAALAEGAAHDWVAIASVDGHGFGNELASVVLVTFVTAMTTARLCSVWLLGRFGRVPVLRVSFALAVLGLAGFILAPAPWAVFASVAVWGVGAALGFPVGMSAAADDPAKAATRVGAVATIGYLSFLGGPPVIGFLGEQFGILSAFLVVVVLCGVGFLLAGSAREPTAKGGRGPA